MQERYIKWFSPSLGREMELLAFGHGGRPVLMFPTSMGRYYQNKDFYLVASVAHLVNEGRVTLYNVDAVDNESWYNKGVHAAQRVHRHMAYDAYLRDEVLPLMRRERGHDRIITAGASFGGYHAAAFAFRYPARVSGMISMGGAFDVRQHLHGYHDQNVYYYNPPEFLPGLQDGDLYRMSIILGTGDQDFCLAANQELSGQLSAKGISHWLDVRPGVGHDWPFWRDMFPGYLNRVLEVS